MATKQTRVYVIDIPFVQFARDQQRGRGERRSERHAHAQKGHHQLVVQQTTREETRQNLRGGTRHVGAELKNGLPLLVDREGG
jgi:hypothetical protein